MEKTYSIIVFWGACVLSLLTILATFCWACFVLFPVQDGESDFIPFLFILGYPFLIAPLLGVFSLFLIIFSGVFYFRRGHSLDLWSLCLTGASFFVLIFEVIILFNKYTL